MIVLIAIFSLLAIAYGCLLTYWYILLLQVKPTSVMEAPPIKLSIVIPFRNEINEIKALIDSLNRLEWDKNFLEIIFVSDYAHSTVFKRVNEETKKLIFDHRVVENILSQGKRHALKCGISIANANYIITIDADVILPPLLLKFYNSYISNGNKLVAGPVLFNKSSNFVQKLAAAQNVSLMGIATALFQQGSPLFCSGANMCFSKSVFEQLGGFDEVDYKGGDDVFVLQKFFKHHQNDIAFISHSDAVVFTPAKHSLKAFIQQQLRWSGKIGKHMGKRSVAIALVIAFFHWAIGVAFLLSLVDVKYFLIGTFLFTFKCLVENPLILKSHKIFGERIGILNLWMLQFAYIFFVIALTVLTPFKKSDW